MYHAVKAHRQDTVAVACADIPAGAAVCVDGHLDMTAKAAVPKGHKLAVLPHPAGGEVIRYGFVVGRAACAIEAGAPVHTHNMGAYSPKAIFYPEGPKPPAGGSFIGYRRADGKVGIRNEVWVVSLAGCVNGTAERLAELARQAPGVNAPVYAFTHPQGCSRQADDTERTAAILAGLLSNPNAGGVLAVGIGCASLRWEQIAEKLDAPRLGRIRFLDCQAEGDELAAGLVALRELEGLVAADERVPVPLSGLVVGLKCGASDWLSGVTANPVVAGFSDGLIAGGGTVLMTETSEIWGGEEHLVKRAAGPQCAAAVRELYAAARDTYRRHDQPVVESLAEDHEKAGFSSAAERALWFLQKGGHVPLQSVLPAGEHPKTPGLHFVDGPGYDMAACTALAAAGAHLILFTTGRGSPFGSPVPTVKIVSNTGLYEAKPGWIDFDAGPMAEGVPLEKLAGQLAELVGQVAGGREALNETGGCRDIAIYSDGITF